MSRVLVSFLGRSFAEGAGYRLASYRFDDGFRYESSFFAVGALAHARAVGTPYDRLLLLGTATSTWDDAALSLGRAENAGTLVADLKGATQSPPGVEQPLLERLSDHLTNGLGLGVTCLRIPDCRTEAESRSLISLLAAEVRAGDDLHLDVTHAYRHLPLMTLFAAMTAEGLGRGRIGRIVYGGLELAQRGVMPAIAPVVELGGIVTFSRWAQALAAYDAGGGLKTIGALIEEETGAQLGLDFDRIDFQLRTLRIGLATTAIRRILNVLAKARGPVTDLFRRDLNARLSWALKPELHQRQALLAAQFLRDGRYMEAAVLGFEASVTRWMVDEGCTSRQSLENSRARSQAQDTANDKLRHMEKTGDRAEMTFARAWFELKGVRNALAHAVETPSPSVQKLLASRPKLEAELQRLFEALLGRVSS